MLTERQEKLLNFLLKEYISSSEPVSSKALKKVTDLDVCGATIRNDLQVLTKQGFIEQPHTSAGRIPTKKAYKYFADKISSENANDLSDFIVPACRQAGDKSDLQNFILQQIRMAHQQIEEEMRLTERLMESLSETSMTLSISNMPEGEDLFEILTFLGISKPKCDRNMDIINKIIKELENF